jgi:ferritin
MEVKKPSLDSKTTLKTIDTQRLSPEIINALNNQISIEFNTVSLFQSMYAYTEQVGYSNASEFFQSKVKEEQGHVNRVYSYMLSKGIRPITPVIPQPTLDYKDLYNIIETCKLYQVGVTQSYEKLGSLALSKGDQTTYNFIQFFLEDQVQEENAFITLCDQYKILSQGGMNGLSWMKLDKLFKQFID